MPTDSVCSTPCALPRRRCDPSDRELRLVSRNSRSPIFGARGTRRGVEGGLSFGEIHQHHIRMLLQSFENNFTT
ncbi:MAG: hypothetical protein ACREAC_08890, partial [Blastocatellia bacterium]